MRGRAIEKRGLTFNLIIMKFEKLSDKKFDDFKTSEVPYPRSIYGGYSGETSNQHQYDQQKQNSTTVDFTKKINTPSTINDGFKDY